MGNYSMKNKKSPYLLYHYLVDVQSQAKVLYNFSYVLYENFGSDSGYGFFVKHLYFMVLAKIL